MFSVEKAHQIQDKKREIKKETYKAILESLLGKVKTAVENGKTHTFVNIPPLLVGYPMYDRTKACEYICRQFIHLGYDAVKYTDTDLYISWTRRRKDKKKEPPQVDVLPPFINLHKFADMYRNKNQ